MLFLVILLVPFQTRGWQHVHCLLSLPQVRTEDILQKELAAAGVTKTEHVLMFSLTPQQGHMYNAFTQVRPRGLGREHACSQPFFSRFRNEGVHHTRPE